MIYIVIFLQNMSYFIFPGGRLWKYDKYYHVHFETKNHYFLSYNTQNDVFVGLIEFCISLREVLHSIDFDFDSDNNNNNNNSNNFIE